MPDLHHCVNSKVLNSNSLYPDNERELLARIAEGDEAAFSQFFNYYYALLKPFVWKFSTVEANREEIIQESFFRIWLHREQLPEVENVRAWVFTVAARVSLGHIRKQFREETKINKLLQQTGEVSESHTPITSLHLAEINRLIRDAVERLSPQRRAIFRMSREDKLKPSEIADQLGISVQTVRNTLTVVLAQIRTHLAKAGYDLNSLVLLTLLFF